MKIRQGFVSNSSSSSFIVALEGESGIISLTVKVDLSKLANKVITTIDDLDEYIMDEYSWNNSDLQATLNDSVWLQETYDAARKAVEEGQRVIWGTVSNDGYEPLENYLYCDGIPESPGMTIISNVQG